MSFNFPSFKSIQDSLSSVDINSLTKSIQNSNATKTVQGYSEQFAHSLQPLTAKVGEQLVQVQAAASQYAANVETSELPAEYLELEQNCDKLLKLYTDLIHFTNDTYAKISYDYPPGNTTLNAIKDANLGSVLGNKFQQLRNATSPQDLENALLGKKTEGGEETGNTPVKKGPVKTMFFQLASIAEANGAEIKQNGSQSVAEVLELLAAAYKDVGNARLEQDEVILNDFNSLLVSILDQQFIEVTDLRKRVYHARHQFDLVRASAAPEAEEESEELIAREDELVNATEAAVTAMKKLLKPSKNVSLLKVLVLAQKAYFEVSAKRLNALEKSLDAVKIEDDDE